MKLALFDDYRLSVVEDGEAVAGCVEHVYAGELVITSPPSATCHGSTNDERRSLVLC